MKKKILLVLLGLLLVIVLVVVAIDRPVPAPIDRPVPAPIDRPVPVSEVGHIHLTTGGGFRDVIAAFVTKQLRDVPVSVVITGASGDLRDYLALALARGKIERGTLFSYNHRHVHQLLEEARPLIAELPGRFPVRPEFAELVDPRGELHLVWVDAYVIIYNPGLIAREAVPSTLAELAKFDQPISVPTTGCLGTWGKMALYHHLGEENFRRLMANAAVRGSLGDVTAAVRDGTVKVGISSLMDVRVRDGEVGVLWPEDGAIAKPALMVIPNNPTEYHFRLADILFSPEAAELFATEFNMASARVGGPVPAIVAENNFRFIFIPTRAIICRTTEEIVNRIIGG